MKTILWLIKAWLLIGLISGFALGIYFIIAQ